MLVSPSATILAHPRALFCGLCAILLGCAAEEEVIREIVRPDEVIQRSDWAKFVKVVDQLPEPKLREIPAVRPPLPQWQEARTLPVDELATEERQMLIDAWEPERLIAPFTRLRGLTRLLRREELSLEQFVGMLTAIGVAQQRATLGEEYPFDDILRRGELAMTQLLKDDRLFASLSIEERHRVLDDAVWLHRVDRAQRLQQVPSENLHLVQQHADWLKRQLPAGYYEHPFADATDLLEEQGLPFIELPESGSDADLEWHPNDAIAGR